ncbi:MAG: hypothetical protein ACRDYC_02880, partial [Acidimicrobiales bacterium]
MGIFVPLIAVTASSASASTATGGSYVPVSPTRLIDTRTGSGQTGAGQTLAANSTFTVTVPSALIPTGQTISGVSIVLTEADATAPGFLTAFPTGSSPATDSALNFVAGPPGCAVLDCVVSNMVIVGVNGANQFSITNGSPGSVDIVIDLEGFILSPSSPSVTTSGAGHFNEITPARLADTRCGDTPPGAGSTCSTENIPANNNTLKTMSGGSTIKVNTLGDGGVPPSGVSAIIAQLTVTNTTAPGFLTAWPTGSTQPLASNVNWVPGQTTSVRAILPVGTGGQISIFENNGSADVAVDVQGWISDATQPLNAGTLFVPVSPVRVTDTRTGSGQANA